VSLGQTPLTTCSFDFSSVLTDVSTMLTVARLVENVGVGAYLGAAHLVSDPTILTAAASIVTVEARHQTILNMFNNGQAIPSAFDLPLLPQEVLALAGSFISGCDLGISCEYILPLSIYTSFNNFWTFAANTALTVTETEAITVNTQLSFSWSGMPSDLSSSVCLHISISFVTFLFLYCLSIGHVLPVVGGWYASLDSTSGQPVRHAIWHSWPCRCLHHI
jgi:hypothetical protein